MSKLNFSKYSSTRKNYDIVMNQRDKLNEYIGLLYKDRSKINLLEFRPTERYVFLKYVAMCRTCHREKRLRNFYDEVRGGISDDCLKCQERKIVISIIENLTKSKESKETENV